MKEKHKINCWKVTWITLAYREEFFFFYSQEDLDKFLLFFRENKNLCDLPIIKIEEVEKNE